MLTSAKQRCLAAACAGVRPAVWLFAFCLGASPLAVPTATAPQASTERQQAEVLFLSAFDPDLPDIDALIQETETQILEGRSTPVHFTVEFLDFFGHPADPSYRGKVLPFLREKYRARTFDLVIAIGEPTLQFARDTRALLFPEAALLFYVARAENAGSDSGGLADATGAVRILNYLPLLQLALRQNPGARSVIVIAGASDFEKLEMQVAREQFRSNESTDFQYWPGLTFRQLASRLAGLQPHSVVLFLDFLSDPAGGEYTPARVLRTVSRTANRPIYGTYSSYVGTGIVGGRVADLRDVGRVLGQDGARILNGEKPESIPVTTGEFQRPIFDWRQLHRWGISPGNLPPGSSVLYWESSPWELYRWRIIGLVLLVLAQALLIGLLVAGHAWRKRALNDLRAKEEERQRAQAELQKSEEKFSKAFRQGPLGFSLTSAETHRYLDVNQTFERFVGYSREELIGHTVFEFEIWADPAERVRLVKLLLDEGELRDVEFPFRRKSGEIRIARASAELIEVAGERCVLTAVVDITESKRAQEALLESEKRFRLMADSAPVLMWLSGPDKLCTDFNQEWLRFTGRTMQEELGEGWTQNVHPDDLPACLEVYGRAFDARQSFEMEYRLRRHDGEYRWVLDRGSPRSLENGGFAGYIGCCIDITNEKLAKAARAEFGGRLMDAQEQERARIARELHDDINQRLALLANGLEELRHTPAGSVESSLRKQLQDLWMLTSEVATDIQQLSHQLHPSKLHYLGLAAAARELCREFSKQHKIAVECVVREMPADLDENTRLSLFRVIQEALRNVAKHSRAHHVRVELSRLPDAVRLEVSDDGVGFDPDEATICGLGLVSMRERLRLVGGQLSVWSQHALGTRIEATVPTRAKAVSAA